MFIDHNHVLKILENAEMGQKTSSKVAHLTLVVKAKRKQDKSMIKVMLKTFRKS